ncbi:MAG: hypothetical protein M0Z41_00820 [Peptococcaceae bacterium]|jgi:hypothetical protein|nr:hypothetical protein [Peptococcaceae bacterium]
MGEALVGLGFRVATFSLLLLILGILERLWPSGTRVEVQSDEAVLEVIKKKIA